MATPTAPRLALGRPALAFGILGAFAYGAAVAVNWWTFTRPTGYVVYVAASSFDGLGAVQTTGGLLLLIAFLSIGFALALLLVMLVHRLVTGRPTGRGRAS